MTFPEEGNFPKVQYNREILIGTFPKGPGNPAETGIQPSNGS